MINYKLYIKALWIINNNVDMPSSEEKAEAICELFDIKQANDYLRTNIGTATTPYIPNWTANYPRDAFWTPIPH